MDSFPGSGQPNDPGSAVWRHAPVKAVLAVPVAVRPVLAVQAAESSAAFESVAVPARC